MKNAFKKGKSDLKRKNNYTETELAILVNLGKVKKKEQ